MFIIMKGHTIYCALIFICWSFNFVFFLGRAIHEFELPTILFIHLSYIVYNLKITNWYVYEHVNHLQTMKFHANEIK